MDLGVKIALRFDGYTDQEVAEIEKALPAAERLLDAEKEFGTLYDKYRADIAAVIPAAKLIINHTKAT